MSSSTSKWNWKQRFATPLSPQLEGQEFRTVIFVAVSFHAVFTGYRSLQNLQSSLNEENGLGVISLGVLYGAWIFSGVLTPTFIRLLTTKGALMLAWVCHSLYSAATFYPTWELLLPASILVGAVSAPLWTAQSLYITACGFSYAKTSVSNPYNIFSRFNGIFYAIYETSQITGNLVSSLVLQNGLGNRSEFIKFRQCGMADCPAADNATDFEEPEDWVVDVLLSVYVSCNLVGIVVTYFFVMPLPKSDWSVQTSTRQSVASFFVTLRRTDIGLLVPLFIFQGGQQALLYSEFTRSYVSCPIGIHMVGFVMAAHGATTPVVTLLFSRIVRHTGRYPLFMLAGLINLGLMSVMYTWTPDKDDVAFIFLVPICWGISEGIWMTQTNSLIAVQYPSEKEPAFAVYHTSRSVGLAVTFALSSFFCASTKVMVGVAFVLAALLFYTVAEVRIRLKERGILKGGTNSLDAACVVVSEPPTNTTTTTTTTTATSRQRDSHDGGAISELRSAATATATGNNNGGSGLANNDNPKLVARRGRKLAPLAIIRAFIKEGSSSSSAAAANNKSTNDANSLRTSASLTPSSASAVWETGTESEVFSSASPSTLSLVGSASPRSGVGSAAGLVVSPGGMLARASSSPSILSSLTLMSALGQDGLEISPSSSQFFDAGGGGSGRGKVKYEENVTVF